MFWSWSTPKSHTVCFFFWGGGGREQGGSMFWKKLKLWCSFKKQIAIAAYFFGESALISFYLDYTNQDRYVFPLVIRSLSIQKVWSRGFQFLSQALWEPGEATVWKHYLDWDKNVFGPNAKKARIVSKTYESSPREHQYAAGLWADTYPANLSPCFLMSLSCMRETKHNLQTQETFHIIRCASPKSRTISRKAVFLLVFHPALRLVGSPVTSNLEAFMHVNRHKFKRLSFNLDDPSFKLYVDTTKDRDEQGWRRINGMVVSTVFVHMSSCYTVDVWRLSLPKSTFLYIQVVWSYHFDCWNTLYIRCFSFTMTIACSPGAQKVETGFVSESTLLTICSDENEQWPES